MVETRSQSSAAPPDIPSNSNITPPPPVPPETPGSQKLAHLIATTPSHSRTQGLNFLVAPSAVSFNTKFGNLDFASSMKKGKRGREGSDSPSDANSPSVKAAAAHQKKKARDTSPQAIVKTKREIMEAVQIDTSESLTDVQIEDAATKTMTPAALPTTPPVPELDFPSVPESPSLRLSQKKVNPCNGKENTIVAASDTSSEAPTNLLQQILERMESENDGMGSESIVYSIFKLVSMLDRDDLVTSMAQINGSTEGKATVFKAILAVLANEEEEE
ncbi:hypothetical protein ABW20_dc0105231 [Dactylellina cionopaga]|nr:hypothetical protein ABW20_dc0105231 [Dactylellina cionopaga]